MEEYVPNNELRPCDGCKGPLGPMFYSVTEKMAVVDPDRANQHMGLTMMFGNQPGSEAIANAMGPGAVYRILDEATHTKFLCQGCHRP